MHRASKYVAVVGKEQEIIGDPRLLQLRRTVSRALGQVLGENQIEATRSCEQHAQPSYNKF